MVYATPRSLYPRERDPVSVVQEAGWVPRPIWTSAKYLYPTVTRYPDRPARNESLYRLSYFGPLPTVVTMILGVASQTSLHGGTPQNIFPIPTKSYLWKPLENDTSRCSNTGCISLKFTSRSELCTLFFLRRQSFVWKSKKTVSESDHRLGSN